MEHDRWVRVGSADDVGPQPPWPVHDVAGTPVRLVRDTAGTIHAVGAACPHLGAPLTHGEVADGQLACPNHWYRFDLTDGTNTFPGWEHLRLQVYPSRVVAGVVEVRMAP